MQETDTERANAANIIRMHFMFIVVLRLEGDVGSDGKDARRRINAAINTQRGPAGGDFRIEAFVRSQGPEILGSDPEAQPLDMDLAEQRRRERIAQLETAQAKEGTVVHVKVRRLPVGGVDIAGEARNTVRGAGPRPAIEHVTRHVEVRIVRPIGGIEDIVAVLTDEEGNDVHVNMIQKWPVKRAMTNYKEKPRPFKLLETGVRVIDTINPIVEGGTGFIPGPFGTGKTVLQHAISKQAEADIVIIAACGERANEVVEIFTEFPELVDPHTGRKLMERTIIIANTSNMPVAAREASVYTAMTIAEYYRSMGLKVLLMADSTSRWAQALREMSNRMEELPGPDAFPMDLSSIISNFYGRAGYVVLGNGETGSITFIGTVSPAGGNLKEPVTENTKKVARCFYALEQDRADKKRYPAVNPIDSYSKYIEYPEFEEYIKKHINGEWIGKVNEIKNRLQRGKEIAEQINILGDDGVPVEYHVTFWKSELIDFVILQQDAFDEIDAVTPMERQEDILNMIIDICHTEFEFDNFNEVMDYFKKMINVCKQMNYSKFKSEEYEGFRKQLQELIEERKA